MLHTSSPFLMMKSAVLQRAALDPHCFSVMGVSHGHYLSLWFIKGHVCNTCSGVWCPLPSMVWDPCWWGKPPVVDLCRGSFSTWPPHPGNKKRRFNDMKIDLFKHFWNCLRMTWYTNRMNVTLWKKNWRNCNWYIWRLPNVSFNTNISELFWRKSDN